MANVEYNSSDGIVEVIVRNEFGEKIEHFKMNIRDKNTQHKVADILFQKYEIELLHPKLKENMFDF